MASKPTLQQSQESIFIKPFKSPIAFHPGETLEEKLEELGMGPKEFAVRTGKPEKTIIAVLKGKSSLTPDMAVRFEMVLGIPARFWLSKQRTYHEYCARLDREQLLKDSTSWARKFPFTQMVRNGWVAEQATAEAKAAELLSFFGFSDHYAWEEYYFNQRLKVVFNVSLASVEEPYATSAWLRKGELQAIEVDDAAYYLEPVEYNEAGFRELLPELRAMLDVNSGDVLSSVQSACWEVGVKVLFTPPLGKAIITGCTRWINGYPVLQFSDRCKLGDAFLFAFFSQAGHVLLHGKKDVHLENVVGFEEDEDKVAEARRFAERWVSSC